MNKDLLIIGDLHLDRHIWRNNRSIENDSMFGFARVIDLARSLRLPLILAGDVFDVHDPDSDVVRFFREQVESLPGDVPVFAIQGNHDRKKTPWYTAVTPKVQHIGDGVVREIGGYRVQGFDYAPRDEIEPRINELAARLAQHPAEAPDLLVLHQAARQRLDIPGAWNFDLDWVPREISRVILGDIHDPCAMTYREGQGRAWYTGSTHPRSVSEFGPKSVIQFQDSAVMRIPLRGRFFSRVVLGEGSGGDPAQDWQETALAGLRESIAEQKNDPLALPPVLWCRFDDSRAPDVAALLRLSKELGFILIQEPAVGRIQAADQQVMDPEVPTPGQALERLLPRDQHPEAHDLAMRLLGTTSSKELTPQIISAREQFLQRETA